MEMEKYTMKNNGIFIVGCPRSGTTLLRQILDSHTELAVVPESSFMLRLKRISWIYGDLNKQKNLISLIEDIRSIKRVKDWFPEVETKEFAKQILKNKKVTFKDVIQEIYNLYSLRKYKKMWADKTPENLLQVNLIKELFPNSKIIIVERDGRDTALSLKKVDFGGWDIIASAYMWKKYVQKAREILKKYPKYTILIKYEDLLLNPEIEIRKILKFLGLKFEEKLFDNYIKHKDDVQHSKSKLYGKKIDKENMFKWESEMNESEINNFQWIAQKELIQGGYLIKRIQNKNRLKWITIIYCLLENKMQKILNKVYTQNHRDLIRILNRRLIRYLKF